MKKKLFWGILLLTGGHGLLSGCSTEELSDTNLPIYEIPEQEENTETDQNGMPNNPETVHLTFRPATTQAQSRVSVVENSTNGNTNVLRWDAGDEVTIWTGNSLDDLTQCTFQTTDGGISSALFEYIGPAVETKTYFGVHNATYYTNDKQIRFIIPTGNNNSPICQTEKNSSFHLNQYRPMYTNIVQSEENLNELTGLHFKHLSSLLVFNIINDSGRKLTVHSVTMKTDNGTPFYSEGVYLTFEGNTTRNLQPTTSRASTHSSYTMLKLGDNGFTSNPDEAFTAYLSTLPTSFSASQNVLLELNIDGKSTEALAIPGNSINALKAGTYYRFNLRIQPNGTLIVVPVVIGDWEEGEDILIPID